MLAPNCSRKGYRIRVNSIHPGVIQTDMGEQTFVSRAQRGRSRQRPREIADTPPLQSGGLPVSRRLLVSPPLVDK
jgi:NAD(P)-dependent dehydrogenase (short-subunit alcohol dehydrogenase family)